MDLWNDIVFGESNDLSVVDDHHHNPLSLCQKQSNNINPITNGGGGVNDIDIPPLPVIEAKENMNIYIKRHQQVCTAWNDFLLPNGVSLMQVAWEMGKNGMKSLQHTELKNDDDDHNLTINDKSESSSSSSSSQTSVSVAEVELTFMDLPQDVIYIIMLKAGFLGALSMGILCHRLYRLWRDEHLHRELCTARGAYMPIMHPALMYVGGSTKWYEFSMRVHAWQITDVTMPRKKNLPTSEEVNYGRFFAAGEPNPLGHMRKLYHTYRESKRFDLMIMLDTETQNCQYCNRKLEDFTPCYQVVMEMKQSESNYHHAKRTSDAWKKSVVHKNTKILRRYNTVVCESCYELGAKSHTYYRRRRVQQTLTAKPSPCTFCRVMVAASVQCILLPYAMVCDKCWKTDGFCIKITYAQMYYHLTVYEYKVMWKGRVVVDPYAAAKKTDTGARIKKPFKILGEDAEAQAIIKYNSLSECIQTSIEQQRLRIRDRNAEIIRIKKAILRIIRSHSAVADGLDAGLQKRIYTYLHDGFKDAPVVGKTECLDFRDAFRFAYRINYDLTFKISDNLRKKLKKQVVTISHLIMLNEEDELLKTSLTKKRNHFKSNETDSPHFKYKSKSSSSSSCEEPNLKKQRLLKY